MKTILELLKILISAAIGFPLYLYLEIESSAARIFFFMGVFIIISIFINIVKKNVDNYRKKQKTIN